MPESFVPFECQACHHGTVRLETGTNRVMPYCREFGLVVPDDLLIPTCGACRETFQNVDEAVEMARQQVALLVQQYHAVCSASPDAPDLDALEARYQFMSDTASRDVCLAVAYARAQQARAEAAERERNGLQRTLDNAKMIRASLAWRLETAEAELKQERVDHNMTATHLAHADIKLADVRRISSAYWDTPVPPTDNGDTWPSAWAALCALADTLAAVDDAENARKT